MAATLPPVVLGVVTTPVAWGAGAGPSNDERNPILRSLSYVINSPGRLTKPITRAVSRPRAGEVPLPFMQRVSITTDGRGADTIIDVGGAQTLAQSVQFTRIGGHIACAGFIGDRESPAFPNVLVMAKNITIAGSTIGSIQDTADMRRAISAHKFRPSIDRVFPFEQAQEAVDHLLT